MQASRRNEQRRQQHQELEVHLQVLEAAGAATAAELEQLSGVAHSSTEELMAAREELQRERAKAEGLVQERAELRGKVGLGFLLHWGLKGRP